MDSSGAPPSQNGNCNDLTSIEDFDSTRTAPTIRYQRTGIVSYHNSYFSCSLWLLLNLNLTKLMHTLRFLCSSKSWSVLGSSSMSCHVIRSRIVSATGMMIGKCEKVNPPQPFKTSPATRTRKHIQLVNRNIRGKQKEAKTRYSDTTDIIIIKK